MQIVNSIQEVRNIIKSVKSEGKSVGFVPTMGALHQGHISLMENSVSECDFTSVSIFVNPIQFVAGEDFEKYPRDIPKDAKMVESVGVDLLFVPEATEILGNDLLTYVDIDKLGNNLCGASRPGHFRGVCTIVAKFFNIVAPDKAYFGKKDIQQLHIIKKMAEDLNFDIEIIPCKIVREEDGLAMSSRNAYLSAEERRDAIVINRSLKDAIALIDKGEMASNVIIKMIEENIGKISYAKVDYVKIVNKNMEDVEKIEKGDIIACAVFFGGARLIDNHIIGEKL